jgi:hypothetical protein
MFPSLSLVGHFFLRTCAVSYVALFACGVLCMISNRKFYVELCNLVTENLPQDSIGC